MIYFADKICLSPNYFGDLVKAETGKTAREHIHLKIIEMANKRCKYILFFLISQSAIIIK